MKKGQNTINGLEDKLIDELDMMGINLESYAKALRKLAKEIHEHGWTQDELSFLNMRLDTYIRTPYADLLQAFEESEL